MSFKTLYVIILFALFSVLIAKPQIIKINKTKNSPRQNNFPFRNNTKNQQENEATDFIREQFNKDRQYHDRDQSYRPPQEEEKNYSNYYLFGISMFALGVLAVISIYLCVFLYNKWLRKKEITFYNNLHIIKPLDTPIIKEKVEVKNEDKVPNARQGIELKMYTNNNIIGATEEV